MGYSGAGGKLIHEKNQKQKISWHCPFKCIYRKKQACNQLVARDEASSISVKHISKTGFGKGRIYFGQLNTRFIEGAKSPLYVDNQRQLNIFI